MIMYVRLGKSFIPSTLDSKRQALFLLFISSENIVVDLLFANKYKGLEETGHPPQLGCVWDTMISRFEW
jgi:hypothetical protein